MGTTTEYLQNQGFSEAEIQELSYLTSTIETALKPIRTEVNYFSIAKIVADRLTTEGSTEKIRKFATQIIEKFKEFSL